MWTDMRTYKNFVSFAPEGVPSRSGWLSLSRKYKEPSLPTEMCVTPSFHICLHANTHFNTHTFSSRKICHCLSYSNTVTALPLYSGFFQCKWIYFRGHFLLTNVTKSNIDKGLSESVYLFNVIQHLGVASQTGLRLSQDQALVKSHLNIWI